jgi:pimeloyl-ACP methyl ester carboxylesterase
VILLHGWPGDRTDYRELIPRLDGCEVVVPDLRGFGESDKHLADPRTQYDTKAHARSVAALITELGLERPVAAEADLDHLVSVYSPAGAFTASISWYRAGAGPSAAAAAMAETVPAPGDRLATPTTVLQPEFDPLFSRDWSDRLDEFLQPGSAALRRRRRPLRAPRVRMCWFRWPRRSAFTSW